MHGTSGRARHSVRAAERTLRPILPVKLERIRFRQRTARNDGPYQLCCSALLKQSLQVCPTICEKIPTAFDLTSN